MGVLTCDRVNCSNVMSERRSRQYGYLCWECFDELVQLGPGVDIEDFMGSKKDHIAESYEASYAYFDQIFKRRDE